VRPNPHDRPRPRAEAGHDRGAGAPGRRAARAVRPGGRLRPGHRPPAGAGRRPQRRLADRRRSLALPTLESLFIQVQADADAVSTPADDAEQAS
jgi:hypothetical protein